MEVNKVIVNEQLGFRKKHSTQTALLNVTNQWYLNMNKGYLNGVIFLDLKKGLGCVNHNILLRKIQCYSINRVPYRWFESYSTLKYNANVYDWGKYIAKTQDPLWSSPSEMNITGTLPPLLLMAKS